MATINNTIYPPIISTYQKAFVKDTKGEVLFNIKFNISEYTDITDIQTIEVKVSTLEGNVSILNGEHYFKSAKDVIDVATRTGSINILKKDIKHDANNEIIDINFGQYYIIQLRMNHGLEKDFRYTGANGEEGKDDQLKFMGNETILDSFSEWSTMSLIKCIDTPVLTLQDGSIALSKINRVDDMSDLKGYLKWENNDNSEFLYSYRFRVYNVEDLSALNTKDYDYIFKNITPLEDSGTIRTSTASPNFMHFVFKTDFVENDRYRVFITYETDNEYEETQYFTFYVQNFISSSNLAGAHAQLSTFAHRDKGCAEVVLTLDKTYLNVPSSHLVFRRASSKNNYKLWDDIHTVKITKDFLTTNQSTDGQEYLKYTWNDWTVESGVFYKYCVQEVDLVGHRAEKIINKHYRLTEDFNKSIMRCAERVPEVLSKNNYAEGVKFSLYTNVNDTNFQQQLEELNENYHLNIDILDEKTGRFKWDSVFISDSFTVDTESDYKFICNFLTEQKCNIYFKIIDEYNNSIIDVPNLLLEQNQENEYYNYFSIDLVEKIKIVCLLDSSDETQKEINEEINEETNEEFYYAFLISNVQVRQLLNYEDRQVDEINCIIDLKDDFIINKDNTLKLGFDTVVSSVTKNRKDTITEAINSKYPFIYRTGKIEYDSYNIEGTISIQGDTYVKFNTLDLVDSWSQYTQESRIKLHTDENIFANKQQLLVYEDIYSAYKKFAERYRLTPQNDFNIEKLFRQKAETFLADGTPKLFKNAELGNKIVMLTEVSLSPKDGTNNMIYSFSATMTEIDDSTVDNYAFYNIIDLLHYQYQNDKNNEDSSTSNKKFENTIGQYSYISAEEEFDTVDILDRINKKYAIQEDNFLKVVDYITKVRIDLSALETPLYNDILGEATVNGRKFLISKHYPYLDLSNVIINSFILKTSQSNKGIIVIDYLTRISNQLLYNTEGWTQYSENWLGQEYLYCKNINTNLFEKIYYKYYNKNEKTEQKLTGLNKILIQAYSDRKMLIPIKNIGIKILDKKIGVDSDDKSYLHLTDKNGIINLDDKNRLINTIEYVGLKITQAENLNDIKDNEYTTVNKHVYHTEQELFNQPKSILQNHMIYQVGQLRLSFFYEGNELDYIAEFGDDDTLHVDVQPGEYDAHDVSEAISRELNNETLTLSETELDTTKYLYLNGNFYKLDEDDYITYPVWLKITYLFELLTREKVS